MAKITALILLLAVVFAAVATIASASAQHGQGSLKIGQCPGECNRRCSKTQYRKPCMFFCKKCCNKCLCVPPGYYGNKGVCSCYNNWKTQQGGPKCP